MRNIVDKTAAGKISRTRSRCPCCLVGQAACKPALLSLSGIDLQVWLREGISAPGAKKYIYGSVSMAELRAARYVRRLRADSVRQVHENALSESFAFWISGVSLVSFRVRSLALWVVGNSVEIDLAYCLCFGSETHWHVLQRLRCRQFGTVLVSNAQERVAELTENIAKILLAGKLSKKASMVVSPSLSHPLLPLKFYQGLGNAF